MLSTDGRGRLFGKLNIVDAAVVLVFGLLIPLSYAAYLLFSPVPARLVAIEPGRIVEGSLRVDVRGEHLRPALRLVVGAFGARLLLVDPENAVLEVPIGLLPGTYDVALLDEDLEIDRLPGALTVYSLEPTPAPVRGERIEVIAIGTFEARDRPEAETLWKRLQEREPDPARRWDVLGLQPPDRIFTGRFEFPVPTEGYEVRAVLRLACELEANSCGAFGVGLAIGTALPLSLGESDLVYRIQALSPTYAAEFANVELAAVGTFRASDATKAEDIRQALQTVEPVAARTWDVVDVQAPELVNTRPSRFGLTASEHSYRVGAELRFRCVSWVGSCLALGTVLELDAVVPVPVGAGNAALGFWIEELREVPAGLPPFERPE